MANLASNPWSLTSADVNTATPTALVLNADGTVTMTLAAGFGTNLNANAGVTLIGNTAAYNGYYVVLFRASATSYTLIPQFAIAAGTGAAAAFGTAGACLYNAEVRVEDMSWQNATVAGNKLDLRDRNGNIVWQATATGAGQQNRGKVFWVFGVTPFALDSGVVIVTVN